MRTRAVLVAVAILVGRFAVMAVVAQVAAPLGWFAGPVVNAVLCVCAAGLLYRWRLLARLGGPWPASPLAFAWLVPLFVSAVSWSVPAGLRSQPPGPVWWITSLGLVGVNEELFARVLVLERLRQAFRPVACCAIGGLLFGLQHLSAFVLTDRTAVDIVENVVLSAMFGFAYCAFQLRFTWIWPLVVLHAAGDFVMTWAARPPADAFVVAQHGALVAFGVLLLAFVRRASEDAPGVGDASPAQRS